MTLRSFYRSLFRRAAVDRDMREEMAAHLEQAVERLMQRGLSAQAAREAAHREFGNVGLIQEESRDIRGGRWIEPLVRDIRFALRHFARTPLTTTTLVLVLALGIGMNSAIFSLLQSFTMRPAPGVPADDALVRIRGTSLSRVEGRLTGRLFSMPELNDVAARRETFAAVAGYTSDQLVLDLADGTDPRVLRGQFVTPNFFPTLGLRPAIGPGLPAARTDDAPGAELVVVIAHWVWDELGSDTTMIGRVVRVNDVPVRVAGVASAGFQGPISEQGRPSLWLPIEARAPLTRSTAHALASRDSTLLDAFGRLTPNTTVEQATAVVRVVAATWAPTEPKFREATEYSSDVVPLRGFTAVENDEVGAFAALGTAALLILLIACTNVSALLVGAAVGRRREIAIRLSLGASRVRVIRQLVTESSLIALAGGALGLTVYWWIIRLIAWLYVDDGMGPDLITVGFTALCALGTGILFGLSPALHATRLDVATALKDTGAGVTSRSRLQRAFIVAQIVLTQPLLVGLAMIVGVTISESDTPLDNPLASRLTRIEFGTFGGSGSPDAKQARVRDFMDRIALLPGVERAIPDASGFAIAEFRVHPADRGGGVQAEETVKTQVDGTAPGFFAFQNIPMLRGRELVADDTAGRGDMAVVIDSDLARGFWGAVDPIGKRLEVTSRMTAVAKTAVVVGVFDVAKVPTRGAGRVYTAHGARWRKDTYIVRTRGAGTTLAPSVRQLARSAIPDIPIYRIATLEQLARQERTDLLLVSASAAGGGLLALLLASIGLYGVVALAVRQRQREIGVRVALGARPAQVVGMFLASGVRLSMLGIVVGLPLSVIALYFIASGFAGSVPINMPLVGSAIAVVVIAVASFASWLPARRAATVDPMETLRTE